MRHFLPLILIILCFKLIAADITATLDTSDGTSGFSFRDSGNTEMFRVDSDGNLTIKGGVRLDSGGVTYTTSETLIVDGRIAAGGVSFPNYSLDIASGFQLSGLSGSILWSERPDSEFDIQMAANSTKRGLSIHAATDGNADNVLAVYGHNGSGFLPGLFVDNNACVGIGTTTPSYSLEVAGSAVFNVSGVDFDTRIAGEADNNLLFADASADMIGIGTSTPGYKLDIVNSGGVHFSGTRIYSDGTGLTYLDIQGNNNNDASGAILRLISKDVADSAATSADFVKYNNGMLAINNNETNGVANTAFGIDGNEIMRITHNQRVGIGTQSPNAKLEVNGDIRISNGNGLYVYDASMTRYIRLLHSNNGNLHMDPYGGGNSYINWYGGVSLNIGNGSATWGPVNASAFNIMSSRRFKNEIRDMEYSLKDLLKLSPKEYIYKDDPDQKLKTGFIAEEVEPVFPHAVSYDENELPLSIDYSKFTPLIVNAVKEQQEYIESLEQEVNILKTRIEELVKRIKEM